MSLHWLPQSQPSERLKPLYASIVLPCRSHLVDAVLEEVENAIDDCEGEVQRLQEVERRLLMENISGPECAGCHEEGVASSIYCSALAGHTSDASLFMCHCYIALSICCIACKSAPRLGQSSAHRKC